MKSYHNIDKHQRLKSTYIGYAHGPWRITKTNSSSGTWHAAHRHYPNWQLWAFGLQSLSMKLEYVSNEPIPSYIQAQTTTKEPTT